MYALILTSISLATKRASISSYRYLTKPHDVWLIIFNASSKSLVINNLHIWKENKTESIVQFSVDEPMRKFEWKDFTL